jgi:hypothetical protein
LHPHDVASADAATAKTERVVPTSTTLSEAPARDAPASLSEIVDGTSNTMLLGEEDGRAGSVRAGDAPAQSISDGSSNTIMLGEGLVGQMEYRDGSVRAGDAPAQSISDGTSNTIMLGEGLVGQMEYRDGSVHPGDAPAQSISDGSSNTILLGEGLVDQMEFRDGSVRTGDRPEHGIRDGTSNTILVGEKTSSPDAVIGSEDDGVVGPGDPVASPPPAIADGTSNTLQLSESDGSGGDVIDTSGGHHRLGYQSTIEAGDVLQGFGTGACEQNVVDLDRLFDSLGVPGAERAARVSLVDTGADVELRLDTDGAGGADLTFLTFAGMGSGLSVGNGVADDIQIGA